MEQKINILIYEKDVKLNNILKEQISKLGVYEAYAATNEKKLLKLLEQLKFKALIINLNDVDLNIQYIVRNYKIKKNFIIGYYEPNIPLLSHNDLNIRKLKKPFKVINLLINLQKLLNSNIVEKDDIFLISDVKYIPFKKILFNLKTNEKEYLTEKENKLLFHLYTNKNIEIAKNDLLSAVWGLSENINTHTLETHIYRLKQKLNKIEPNLSFLLSSYNGLYSINFKN